MTNTAPAPDDDRYRFTMTITPISDGEMQRIIDWTRVEFGRGPLIHVIGKQPRSTHIGEAPHEWIEQRNAALRIALQARHAAGRWENPVHEPDWVEHMLTALGQPHAVHCEQCADAPRRRKRDWDERAAASWAAREARAASWAARESQEASR
jgi:hypothetical protein